MKKKTRRKIKHTIYFIFIIFLSLTMIMNLYLYFTRQVMQNRRSTFFGLSSAIVVSGSMLPTINYSDLIFTIKSFQYNIGDIITFDDGRSLVTHRIVEIEDGKYITKGDNNNTNDENPVEKDKIVGKVFFVVKSAGKILRNLQTPFALTLLFSAGFLIMYYPRLFEKDD